MSRQLLSALSVVVISLLLLLYGAVGSRDPRSESSAGSAETGPPSAKTRPARNRPRQPADDATDAEYLGRLEVAARDAGAEVLSTGDSCDDFTSVAQGSDGTLFAAYAAYYDGHDQIRLHRRLPNGRWSTRTHVPLAQARADIWMPQLAVDAQDRLWVIWSEQTGQSDGKTGNWDLYARSLVNDTWGKLVRLTTDPKPDINPHVAIDAKRNIHVVWQAHPNNAGDIYYCKFDGTTWSSPLAVTSDPESDWFPRVAVDKSGTAWIAFDSYRNGDYDVFLTSVRDGRPGRVIPIATSSYYEAHASVACDRDGAVWVAWEQGGPNWGKDVGYWLQRNSRNQGSSLGSTRRVKVACYRDGKLLAAADVQASLADASGPAPASEETAMAALACGQDGRIWLRFRHMVFAQPLRARPRGQKGWVESITTLSPKGWTPAIDLAASAGRISVFSRILPAQDGSLWVGYSSDARTPRNYHRPIQDVALITNVPAPPAEIGVPQLSTYQAPDAPAGIPPWNASREAKQVERIRAQRVSIGGVPQRIVRGDLHRHTEMSWDVGPGNDGSYLDFYRYMIDVASMDFGSLTDHQGGGHYAYWWWLTQKSADMYFLPPRFVPLYGYERSVVFPNGHRNVFHASRGVPVFPFQLKLDQTGVFPGIGTGQVVTNDTKLLYEFLSRTGGLAISHTSGTSSMGTDWRDNDPSIEPVVEMYQGARNSYETLDAPRVHGRNEKPDSAPGGFQQAGLVWKAYAKGYRLGTISSSDHGSTHISYALVYTPENERSAVLDSIRQRHTYGATDNIVLDFQANGHFMGEEFTTAERPHFTLHAIGTEKIANVTLVRNNEYVFSSTPRTEETTLEYTDEKPKTGQPTLYYVRLEQTDGQLAWSSPVWITYTK
ncbi:MAG TPA: hypothetical protein VMR25_27425 [Planctomycetaceae bacterium]|jgi:hypothetical protein|nr:hypothetical protein [Planctomycetaceae bacterium]